LNFSCKKLQDKRFTANFRIGIPQKVAETLAIATMNYQRDGCAQEVFGIGVRHHYFTFWHTVFPASYLDKIIAYGTTAIAKDDFAVTKFYPTSNFGLDFCDPKDRKEIISHIVSLKNYLKDTPKIGTYKK